jgi:hypothetical protein
MNKERITVSKKKKLQAPHFTLVLETSSPNKFPAGGFLLFFD